MTTAFHALSADEVLDGFNRQFRTARWPGPPSRSANTSVLWWLGCVGASAPGVTTSQPKRWHGQRTRRGLLHKVDQPPAPEVARHLEEVPGGPSAKASRVGQFPGSAADHVDFDHLKVPRESVAALHVPMHFATGEVHLRLQRRISTFRDDVRDCGTGGGGVGVEPAITHHQN